MHQGLDIKSLRRHDVRDVFLRQLPQRSKKPWEDERLGTYRHHPFRKENDLNQTSMIIIFQGVAFFEANTTSHKPLVLAVFHLLFTPRYHRRIDKLWLDTEPILLESSRMNTKPNLRNAPL